MRYRLFAGVLAACFAATSSYGEERSGCENAAIVAEQIMAARQDELPKDEVMEVTELSFPGIEMFKRIVLLAYEMPLQPSAEAKKSSVATFRKEVELACIRQGY